MDWGGQKNSWESFGHNAKRKKKRTQLLLRASSQLCHGERKATMWSRHARLVGRDWGKLAVTCVDFSSATLSPTDNDALRGMPIDLYQIHFPGSWSNEEYWDGIADAYDQGLVNAVGMFSNFLQLCLVIYFQ
jgi:hypothetical protein